MNSPNIRHLKRTATVAALVVFGMVAGLLVEISIARSLAASEPVQIYRLSFSLPLLLALTVSGALVNTALAELSRARRISHIQFDATVRFVNRCLVIGACLVALAGVATVSIQQRALAPGLVDGAVAQFKLAATFGWLMFFLMASSNHIRAQVNLSGMIWLNPSVALQRNIGFLAVFLILFGFIEPDQILPICALAASVAVISVHIVAGRACGATFGLGRFGGPTLERSHRLSILRALVISLVFQLLATSTTLADRAALSVWDVGHVPHLDYSVAVITGFGALFANVTSIIILPMLLGGSEGSDPRQQRVRPYVITYCAVALAVSIGLAAGRTPIIALLFERGAFLASDTQATADFLYWHASGLFFLILNSVYFVVTLARGNVVTLLPIAVLRWVVRITLLLLLPEDLPPATRIGVAYLVTEATTLLLFQGLRQIAKPN